jgi:hypothetical protein
VAHRDNDSSAPAYCKLIMPTRLIERSFCGKTRHAHFISPFNYGYRYVSCNEPLGSWSEGSPSLLKKSERRLDSLSSLEKPFRIRSYKQERSFVLLCSPYSLRRFITLGRPFLALLGNLCWLPAGCYEPCPTSRCCV